MGALRPQKRIGINQAFAQQTHWLKRISSRMTTRNGALSAL
jgi:hypothetical protein